MRIQLYAQPYYINATGFYFRTLDDFEEQATKARTECGAPCEEFELQFIEGERIDCALAQAIGLNQANLAQYLAAVEAWEDHQKTIVIIAVGGGGYAFDEDCDPDGFDIDIYHAASFTELAEQFVEDGIFGSHGDLPSHYIDFEAIGRDLAMDYTEKRIAGQQLIYRLG